MHNAIAKCGVLKKKSSILRRKETRFYVLTNAGGFFVAKGFAAEFDSIKPWITLDGYSEASLERGSSGDANYVMRIASRGNKPPVELEALSEPETVEWYQAVQDVIELVKEINGDEFAAQPRPLGGLRPQEEGWYIQPTGHMALYTLNSDRRWVVQDKREYDEATVLNRIANDRVRRSGTSSGGMGGYPSQGDGAAAIGGSSADEGSRSPDYRVNSLDEPGLTPTAYPVQQQYVANSTMLRGGGGDDTWATPATVTVSSSRFTPSSGSRSADGGGSVVGGAFVGGRSGGGVGRRAEVNHGAPPPVLPSTFEIGKGDGDGLGDDVDNLVLRRPSALLSGNGGGGAREEPLGADLAAAANPQGRLGRIGRWRGGAGGGGAAAPERRQSVADGGRPLELSPGMEALQSWLSRS